MNIEATFEAIASGELTLEQFKIWLKTQLDKVSADTWVEAYDEGHADGYNRGYADGRD